MVIFIQYILPPIYFLFRKKNNIVWPEIESVAAYAIPAIPNIGPKIIMPRTKIKFKSIVPYKTNLLFSKDRNFEM